MYSLIQSINRRTAVIKLTFFLLLSIGIQYKSMGEKVNRGEFYEVYSAPTSAGIDRYIQKLNENETSSEIKALKGALLMRKAGLLSNAGEKLRTFKEGRLLLEEVIKNEPSNPEYRFLRLTIQERCPKILGYKSNIEQDKTILLHKFEELNPAVRTAILNYSKNSTVIKPNDFK